MLSRKYIATCLAIFAVYLVAFLAYLILGDGEVQISDVSRPQTLTLRTRSPFGVSSIWLHIHWQINGTALISGGTYLNSRAIAGSYDLEIAVDCYEPVFDFRYSPVDVGPGSGNVTVEYNFRDPF